MRKYKELLKDGRWQVRKTDIMLRDGFKCQMCGAEASGGVTLNVHHLRYKRNTMPWDYADEDLVTLCESCHQKVHQKEKVKKTKWKVGDFVMYEHSDYENYGFIFSINPVSLQAEIATVDIGGSGDYLFIDKLSIKEDAMALGNHTIYECKMGDSNCSDFYLGCSITAMAKIVNAIKDRNYQYLDSIYGNSSWDALKEMYQNREVIVSNNQSIREYLRKEGIEM